MMDTTSFLSSALELPSPWNYVLTAAVACGVNATLQWLLRPRHHPPFYCEFPYIPWLGSIVQFATQPREFLQRAANHCGPVFTIQLFGKKMTFLFGTDGHAHFFRAKEDVFDIREAYAMTVTTFGKGVCYDVPQSRMAEQVSVEQLAAGAASATCRMVIVYEYSHVMYIHIDMR